MNKDRIEMSQQERDRIKVMSPVLSGKRTQVEAARLLKRSVRQRRKGKAAPLIRPSLLPYVLPPGARVALAQHPCRDLRSPILPKAGKSIPSRSLIVRAQIIRGESFESNL